jgi:type II secretory pathway component PulK
MQNPIQNPMKAARSVTRNPFTPRLTRGRHPTALVVAGMLASATDARAASTSTARRLPSSKRAESCRQGGGDRRGEVVRPFASIEELERVRGIGPALVAELRPHVTVSSTPASKPR